VSIPLAGDRRNPPVAKRTSTKKSSSRKKPATRKKTASRAASGTRRKKTTTKKKTTAKKRPTKKKTTRKKTTASSRKKTTTKKKTATKKSASRKKTTAKKSPTRKKTTAKKSKTTKKAVTTARSTRKKAEEKTAAAKPNQAATGKKRKKKSKAAGGSRSLGARSVAEAASAAKADDQGYVYINGRRVRMISTKGQPPPKKSRSPKPTTVPEDVAPKATKPIKTKLSAKDLRYFRDLLLLKRAELVGDLSAMQEAALEARGGNLSNLPIHMADIGTDTFDQDFMLGLAETERQRLREIDDALARIADKTYGVCQMTGKPIPKARLNAKPWAKYTIEAARQVEGQWRP
jgi:RNA polymerase-binding transcription factor DksA